MSVTISKDVLAQQYTGAANLTVRISLHERFSTNPLPWHRWVFDQLDLPPTAQILEIGGGVGRLWQENIDHIPAGWHITLTDFSSGMLATAQQNTAAIKHQFAYKVVDILQIPFENNQFDAVIANHMLYYLTNDSDKAQAFTGVRRVLKQDGRFFATTNGLSHMQEMVEIVHDFDATAPFVTDVISNFSLENGPDAMAKWFSAIELRRYPDELIVTEVQPLIDFILSASTIFTWEEARKAELQRFIQERFEAQGGVLKVKKDPGIILARC